jgi:hypothetical protein
MTQTNDRTYNELLTDDKFLSAAYHSLRALGENVGNDRKQVLDLFLTKRRYFDTNVASTFAQGDRVKDMSDEAKRAYVYALDEVDKMPTMFAGGSAPKWKALKDYAIAGATDPTNLLSILAGAFTLGTGGAAIWGAKEAAKQGVKETLKAKVRALGNKAVLKSLAVEGTVAGAGGTTSALRRQNVDMDLGRREKNNYNYLEAGAQGLLEGILSPVAGAGINIGGTAIKGLTKGTVGQVDKLTGNKISNSQDLANVRNFLAKWLLPQGGLDATTARSLEMSEGAFKPIKDKAEKVSNNIDRAWRKDFTDNDIDLINLAMEGDKSALKEISSRSPDMNNALTEFFDLRNMAYKEATDPAIKSSAFLQNIWKKNPNYVRDVYERYTTVSREPFDKWIEKPENKSMVKEFTELVQTDANLAQRLKIRDTKGNVLITDPDQIENIIKTEMRYQYDPKLRNKSKLGALKSKDKSLNPALKKLLGINANPAIRATETIAGIIEPVTDIRMAGTLADSLLNRGLAFSGPNRDTLAREAGINERLVKLITKRGQGGKKLEDASPFTIRGNLYSKELEDVWVPKSLADKLKVMVDNQQVKITEKNSILNGIAAAQGYMKKGKTVYNPFGHIRNMYGMLQYTANSGNYRGIADYVKFLTSKTTTKEDKQAFLDNISRLGLKGSAVELNQILNRIKGAARTQDGMQRFIQGVGSFGVSELERTGIGKRTSDALTNLYGKTDDIGKIMTFMSERHKAGKLWNALDNTSKEAARLKYINDFGQPLDNKGKALTGKAFDNKVIDEMATQKALDVVPVYSRIPKVLEAMRGIPVVGSFTAFPAENLRNKYKILKLGAEEIRDGFELGWNTKAGKELVKTGSNRLLAQGTFAGSTTAAAYVYNSVMGTDTAMDMIRDASPEWEKYHALQVRPGDDGKLYVTDLSYLNPDQYVLDMIMPLMVTAANGEDILTTLDNGMESVIQNMYEPFIDPSLASTFSKEMLTFITEGAKKVMPVLEADEKKMYNSLAKAYKITEPGAIKLARELAGDFNAFEAFGQTGKNLQKTLDPLYYGEKRKDFDDAVDTAQFFAKYGINVKNPLTIFPAFSLKEREFDPQKQMAFAVKNLMGKSNKEWTNFNNELKNNLQDPELSVSPISLLESYKEALEENYVAQQGVSNLLSSFVKYYGVKETNKLINKKVIKNAGQLSSKEIRALFQNKFAAPELPDSFWQDLKEANPRYSYDVIVPLKRKFNELYKYYNRKNLGEDLPEINISKGNN